MAIDYILVVQHHEGELYQAVTEAGVAWPSHLKDFDPDDFGPGLFVITAGNVHKPPRPMKLEEIRDWLNALDGRVDKVVGGTVTCKVSQPA